MPSRLRPTAPFAADAILAGDPGRALLLAQELLEQPKMSNHARGLWGYTGMTPQGDELTIQSTGMGGPSAALVLADLAELGVRRAVRVGSCLATRPGVEPGELLLVEEALAAGGSAAAFELDVGASARPDPALTEGLRAALGEAARGTTVASFDHSPSASEGFDPEVGAADMQTVAVLARAAALGIAAAAVLVVVDSAAGEQPADEDRERSEKSAGRAASKALSASS
jgi:purine-nucleoside phosphorylase